MFVNKRSTQVLVEFAMRKLGEAPFDEQIKLYHALGDVMPTRAERKAARDIATALSKAAALQLDFKLFTEPQRPGQPPDGAHGGKACS